MFTNMRTVKITLILVLVTKTVSPMCSYENSVELTNKMYNGIYYKDGEYFVDNTTGLNRGCVCMKEKCFRKCCPFGQGFHKKKKMCVDIPEEFDPPIFEGSAQKMWSNVKAEFHFLFHKMNCLKADNEYRMMLTRVTTEFHLKTDGKLYAEQENDNQFSTYSYNAEKYCVDNFLTDADEKRNRTVSLNGFICYSPKVESNHYGVSAGCMLISCFFMVLTVAVYIFLPELRTLHGMVMVTYLLSFFVAFLFMATMQILLLVDNITLVYCTFMTFVIYFSVLAAFFWLNVMCYDLWSKLRSSRNMAHGFASSKRTRFLLYCSYAFGVPTLLTSLVAALEFSDLPAHIELLPHIRRKGCFLNGTSKLLYLYSPILVLCIANLIFFILTAIRLTEMKKQTQVAVKKGDTQRFTLYIKLFIVTGINWVLEVISSFYPNADSFWQYTDAYNVLVGLMIFIIFVCKKKTFLSIKRRYLYLRGIHPARTESSIKSTVTETSQCNDDIRMNTNITHTNNEEKKEKVNLTTHGFSAEDRIKFRWYCAYAFGVPTVLTILMVGLAFSGLTYHPCLPNIKRNGCFIRGISKFLYLYLPMLIVLLVNLVFIGLLTRRIIQIKKQTQWLQKKDSQRFALYIKLFVVSGINWVFEAISSFYPQQEFWWRIPDAYNVLLGLIIFLIFIAKKSTLVDIKNRYKQLRGERSNRVAVIPGKSTQTQETMVMSSAASIENMTEKNK